MNDYAEPRGGVREPVDLAPDVIEHQDPYDPTNAHDELWGSVGTISMLETLHDDDDTARGHLRAAKHHLRLFLGAEVEPDIRFDPATALARDMLSDIEEEWGETSERALGYRARLEDLTERGETYRADVESDLADQDLERRRAMLDRPKPEDPYVAAARDREAELQAARVEARRQARAAAPAQVAEELENTVAFPEEIPSTVTSSDLPEIDSAEIDAALAAHDERS